MNTDILAEMKRIDFTEPDIRARTEMSESRILYDKVQLLLFGKIELSSIQAQADSVDSLVNDLLQYINEGMSSAGEAGKWNTKNSDKVQETYAKCGSIAGLKSNSSRGLANGRKLVEDGRNILESSRQYFSELSNRLGDFKMREKGLEEREIGLSGVVEDYRTRFILPCQANAEKLFSLAEKLENMFDKRYKTTCIQGEPVNISLECCFIKIKFVNKK